ncbi:MAG: hypothetical protein WKF71_11830 [Pyrinomonadaceae bacterium]
MKKANRSAALCVRRVGWHRRHFAASRALLGYTVFSRFSPKTLSPERRPSPPARFLAMLADTMIPEAFEEAHDFAGLITVLGFLAAFVLTKIGG